MQVGSINPVTSGSIVALPPGSIVPVAVNGSIVPVKTTPVLSSQTVQIPKHNLCHYYL